MENWIGSSDLLNIIKKTLDRQNARLVDHGSRVGYLAAKMLETGGKATREQIVHAYVLGLLHDVGAYKTSEINELMQFESEDVWQHAIYGYLLVRAAGALDEVVDAILFHHLPWNRMETVECAAPALSNLIYLADRAEVYIRANGRPADMETLSGRPGRFSPENLALFKRADRECGIQNRLLDGSYVLDVERYFHWAAFEPEALLRYIRLAALFIDFRSETTVTHTITTVSVSLELARLFGLSDEERQDIYLGAYLHDFGKVVIPTEIIEKPGKLTSTEMEIMKTHVVHTGYIIRGYVSEEVYRIATRHHEKPDGSGYPLGLMEDELNLSEQIVAAADVFSALFGSRSYKTAFPKEKIGGILNEMAAARKLSGRVVEKLDAHYDEIVENTRRRCEALIGNYQSVKKEYDAMMERVRVRALI